jgi:hypothetical protein
MTAHPLFPRVVDDTTVRLVAAVVLVLAIAALALHQWWIYVGCKVFAVLMKLGVVPEEICLECAEIGLRPRQVPRPV